MDDLIYFTKIYKEIFSNNRTRPLCVFLCGGTAKNNTRNKLKPLLKNYGYKVMYPENLFLEMLNRDKKVIYFSFITISSCKVFSTLYPICKLSCANSARCSNTALTLCGLCCPYHTASR